MHVILIYLLDKGRPSTNISGDKSDSCENMDEVGEVKGK